MRFVVQLFSIVKFSFDVRSILDLIHNKILIVWIDLILFVFLKRVDHIRMIIVIVKLVLLELFIVSQFCQFIVVPFNSQLIAILSIKVWRWALNFWMVIHFKWPAWLHENRICFSMIRIRDCFPFKSITNNRFLISILRTVLFLSRHK